MTHHTKTFGDLGVLHAKIDLLNKGYFTCTPDTEHSPFDLVAFKEGKCYTVQVKARTVNVKGCIEVAFKSNWTDRKGTHIKPVNKSNIDLYCIFCLDTNNCYYFDPKVYAKSITIRVLESKNNQTSNVNWHEDFLTIPKL